MGPREVGGRSWGKEGGDGVRVGVEMGWGGRGERGERRRRKKRGGRKHLHGGGRFQDGRRQKGRERRWCREERSGQAWRICPKLTFTCGLHPFLGLCFCFLLPLCSLLYPHFSLFSILCPQPPFHSLPLRMLSPYSLLCPHLSPHTLRIPRHSLDRHQCLLTCSCCGPCLCVLLRPVLCSHLSVR